MKNLSDQKEDVVQRYVDIMTNAGFKALFGDMNDERRQKGIYAAFKKKGFECGLKEGREIGVKAGREEGRVEGVMTVAREMKRRGMELETIAKATGLDLKVIEGL